MRLSEFDYDLPAALIAQRPAENRDDSRLMLVPRAPGGRPGGSDAPPLACPVSEFVSRARGGRPGRETPGAEAPGAGTPGAEAPGAEARAPGVPGAEAAASGAEAPRAGMAGAEAGTPEMKTPGVEAPGSGTPGARASAAEAPGAERPGAEAAAPAGVTHHVFRELDQLLRPGDLLVFNQTKVIPARLMGEKADAGGRFAGGAAVETLLLRDLGGGMWECLVRPGRRLPPGTRIRYGRRDTGRGRIWLEGQVLERTAEGGRVIRFEFGGDGGAGAGASPGEGPVDGVPAAGGVAAGDGFAAFDGGFMEVLEAFGEMPLPPYITAKPDQPDRYQTVYARIPGSVAAPTAGLHFTPALLDRLKRRGVEMAEVLLHVGLGTFRPVSAETVEDHVMHREYYELTDAAAFQVNRALKERRRVIAVGTTSVRTLEACAVGNQVQAGSGWTDIFIYPGYEFQIISGLITNFHLPKSTLLMLVCALAGKERVLSAYQEAIDREYRFFSFGDAMLIM